MKFKLSDVEPSQKHWKRIKFVLKHEEYKEMLLEIERLNRTLQTLTGQRRSTCTERRLTKASSVAIYYSQIRRHSANMYDALYDIFHRNPSVACLVDHNVNLQLEGRRSNVSEGKAGLTVVKDLRFKVMFSFDCTPEWRSMEIEPMEGPLPEDIINNDKAETASSTVNTPTPSKEVNSKSSRLLLGFNKRLHKLAHSSKKQRLGRALYAITGRALVPLESQSAHPSHEIRQMASP